MPSPPDEQQQQQRQHLTSQRKKAWNVLSILLKRLRRPATPAKLASMCDATTAEQVLDLCGIPNSPIAATEGLVAASAAAVAALGVYAPGSARVLEGCMMGRNKTEVVRKRKGAGAVTSMAKRRLLLRKQTGEADGRLVSAANTCEYNFLEGNCNDERALGPLLIDSSAQLSSFQMTHFKHVEEGDGGVWPRALLRKESPGSIGTSHIYNILLKNEPDSFTLNPIQVDGAEARFCDLNLTPPSPNQEVVPGHERMRHETDFTATLFLEEAPSIMDAVIPDTNSGRASEDQLNKVEQTIVGSSVQEGFIGSAEKFDLSEKAYGEAYCFDFGNTVNNIDLNKDLHMQLAETNPDCLSAECPFTEEQPARSSENVKSVHKTLSSKQLLLVESLEDNEVFHTPKPQNQCKSGQNSLSVEHKMKTSNAISLCAKENNVDSTSISPKLGRKKPHFEDFIIEEEEGSGGYGTVYRAHRKNDGKRFAIKCPHAKAQKQHVDNERKILERFGGRNFIIKYENSFTNGDTECFILEHVEHDRPEVLKKKIELFELQWYGYCMFKALSCLHKQGVVHRDVKPGNFLFSRKLSKGYLIDFNLAMDLQQKYAIGNKPKSSRHVTFAHVPLPQSKSALSSKGEKNMRGDPVDLKKTVNPNRTMKKRAQGGPSNNNLKNSVGNLFKSQCADGSGITSTKDHTSTRTSAERVREPMPCLGRKELLSLAQNVICSPNHDVLNSPGSKRKRVAATPGNIENKLIYTSPMPLHFTGVAVSSASLLKSKGDTKQKREGPCAGTKGFRAPEVLFRSLHQGPKVDVWSAGVTLLYLMIGRAPFTGDPEQNIKDIAKLKGSEDLWEVAKLHDRESSFPAELLDVKSMPSMKLQSWCKAHTKRPEFFSLIPRSLFDLINKCLTVNPRLRISAEEALSHEFFASCHESLRKLRLSRRDSMSSQNDLVHESS